MTLLLLKNMNYTKNIAILLFTFTTYFLYENIFDVHENSYAVKAQPAPTQSPKRNRKNIPRSRGLGPNVCGGKSLIANIPAYGVVIYNITSSITFNIPCKTAEVESLVFSLHRLPEGKSQSIKEEINISSIPASGNYTHTFDIPDENQEYRWYLNMKVKDASGRVEIQTVSGYVMKN
jgi:hypothetical protein